MTKQIRIHFDAEINEEDGSIGLAVDWETSIKFAVMALTSAAEKHPQIRQALELSVAYMDKVNPLSDEERMMAMLETMLSRNDKESEEANEVASLLRGMQTKGDA